jgi:hypothetical protein
VCVWGGGGVVKIPLATVEVKFLLLMPGVTVFGVVLKISQFHTENFSGFSHIPQSCDITLHQNAMTDSTLKLHSTDSATLNKPVSFESLYSVSE